MKGLLLANTTPTKPHSSNSYGMRWKCKQIQMLIRKWFVPNRLSISVIPPLTKAILKRHCYHLIQRFHLLECLQIHQWDQLSWCTHPDSQDRHLSYIPHWIQHLDSHQIYSTGNLCLTCMNRPSPSKLERKDVQMSLSDLVNVFQWYSRLSETISKQRLKIGKL